MTSGRETMRARETRANAHAGSPEWLIGKKGGGMGPLPMPPGNSRGQSLADWKPIFGHLASIAAS
jgi:hypothetical protein